jgi:acyl-CoA hydrolase
VRDGGTLQIGIGSLSDALCHALVLRHTRNADYLRMLDALDPALRDSALVRERGGTAPFAQGLYGASEMVNDGFMHLRRAGILVRKVLDDLALMQRIDDGSATRRPRAPGGRGALARRRLLPWARPSCTSGLRSMPAAEARGLGMTRISHINELYGGLRAAERLQRREARFFNTCMMATALGAAVSDALEDGREVSGIGGQYNFVAMAHALRGRRSVLLFQPRSASRRPVPLEACCGNTDICSIPRHLRDVYVNEYGVADLRGIDDAGLRARHAGDHRCALRAALRECGAARAEAAGGERLRSAGRTPGRVARGCALPRSGLSADYPLGCDFTPVEQRLAKALGWLKSATATARQAAHAAARLTAAAAKTPRAMERMHCASRAASPNVQARLLRLALEKWVTVRRRRRRRRRRR